MANLKDISKRRRLLAIILASVILLVLILGIGLGLGLQNKAPSTTPSSSPSSTSALSGTPPGTTTGSPTPNSTPPPPQGLVAPPQQIQTFPTDYCNRFICDYLQQNGQWPGITIKVYSPADWKLRLQYPANATVTLELQNDIAGPLEMNGTYSNTWVVSPCCKSYSIMAPTNVDHALWVHDVKFSLIMGINLITRNDYVTPNKTCKLRSPTDNYLTRTSDYCPAMLIETTSNTSFVGMNIFGRIDISRINDVRLDGLNISMANNSWLAGSSEAAVNVHAAGDSKNLVHSRSFLQNSRITSVHTGVMVSYGTSGFAIRNNYLGSVYWTAIQVDQNVHNVATAVLINITRNHVYRPKGFQIAGDSGAIYMDTHWFTTKNYIEDNYLQLDGVSYCYYVDYVSSWFQIKRTICDTPGTQFKINTGKGNIWTESVVVNPAQYVGNYYVGCQNAILNNCQGNNLGAQLYNSFVATYNTAAWRAAMPQLFTFCSDTTWNGLPCSPNSTYAFQSGNCSGIPTDNVVSYALAKNYTGNTACAPNITPVPWSFASAPDYNPKTCGTGASGNNGWAFPISDVANNFTRPCYHFPTHISYGADGFPRVKPGSQLDIDYPTLVDFPWSQLGVRPTTDWSLYFQGLFPNSMDY